MEDNFVSLDASFFKTSDVDPDYEFDAARFFDFTRPESSSEAEEAENWFLSIGSYPPSPFALRLYGREHIKVNNSDAPPKSNHGGGSITTNISTASDVDLETQSSVLCDNDDREESHRITAEDISNAKSKTSAKSSRTKNSTLMKPTASHLAKINHAREVFSRHFGRSDKSSITSDDRSSRSSQVLEATKRQRLENGYLLKIAKLKHQNMMPHKLPKVQPVDASIFTSKPKVTKPREPNLETAVRAQRQRLKNTIETSEHAKDVAHVFKARPLNRKIFKTPSFRPTKKDAASAVIQELTTQSFNPASTESATDTLRMSREDSISKNSEFDTLKPEANCLLDNEELSLLNDNRLSHNNPPTELFSKLSLKGESELITVSGKDYKENIPGCFNQEIKNY
ncbi:protein TPX2-like isoform X2 [Impatiens glandulifera]|uniref:protein TPX2-like isoform X2 n=1 Tax=Impatiens glandulifera TaxID=253017 RepID=UPI001FB04C04|nr:protein TPX2-like isoform X2 [Impatiens glandulifera]